MASRRGIALNTLADLAGVGQSHLYAVLGCRRAASVDWIAKVADALHVPAAELLVLGAVEPRTRRRRR